LFYSFLNIISIIIQKKKKKKRAALYGFNVL
jgi:hypothetical protein